MTPDQVAVIALPKAKAMLAAAQPEIRAAAGIVRWLAAWPSWSVLTSDPVLLVLLRIGVGVTAGTTAPWLLPLLLALVPVMKELSSSAQVQMYLAELIDLMNNVKANPEPAVVQALSRNG